jgi:hypothetical protein
MRLQNQREWSRFLELIGLAHIFQLHGLGGMPEAQIHTTKYVMDWMEMPLSKYKNQL